MLWRSWRRSWQPVLATMYCALTGFAFATTLLAELLWLRVRAREMTINNLLVFFPLLKGSQPHFQWVPSKLNISDPFSSRARGWSELQSIWMICGASSFVHLATSTLRCMSPRGLFWAFLHIWLGLPLLDLNTWWALGCDDVATYRTLLPGCRPSACTDSMCTSTST